MALDLSGFLNPTQKYEGLTNAANTLEKSRDREERLDLERQGHQAATSKFLTDYLDPKEHLTGTAYDPQVVGGLNDILQQAQQLAAKGVATPDIMMAIGPSVNRLNQYSEKAKLINQQIKGSVSKLTGTHGYAGYNAEALEQEAKKQAFYDEKGKLKDISTIDPNQDYVSLAAKNSPELVTSGKGLDDFVAKTPMADYSRNVTTTYAGRSKNVRYEAKHPFWEDVQRDENGNIIMDASGNPIGLGVVGSAMIGDDGKPIMNPETKEPFQVMNKDHFNVVMQHNPDIADFIRGQVNTHFRAAGAKTLPAEGSPQWDMMARHLLRDELANRSKSSFKTIEQQKESAPAVKVEIGQNPQMLNDLAKYESAAKLKGDYAIYDPKSQKSIKTNAVQTVGEIFNNNQAFLQGESKDLPDGRTVIDVTSSFPGGGLKTGRGADDIYKSIYYDPNKRSLIVESEGKQKDASGQKPISYEEIPESKAGLFMSRIAAANGVDPGKLNNIFNQIGYKGARFGNAGSLPDVGQRVSQEHADRMATVDKAVNNDKFDELKGHQTKDGKIQEVSERTLTSWIPGRDKYGVKVKTVDGSTKTVTFNTKEELSNYIKGDQKAQATKPEELSSSPADWKKLSNGTYQYKDGSVYDASGKKIK